MPKLLSGYTTALPGVVNFTDPNHPGFGFPLLILTGNDSGSFEWQDSSQGNTHSITVCIPWENLGSFRNYVITSSQSTTVSGVTTITRTLPLQSPFIAQFPNTYAVGLSGKGSGSDASVSDTRLYSDLIIALTFGTLPYPTEGGNPFLEVNYAGSADYDTVPDAKLSFATSGEAIDHDAGVLVGQLAIQITAHQIPDVNAWKANLMPLKGKVSSADVVIDGFTHPAGTLLFPTFDATKTVDSTGNITSTGTIQLIQRDLPWNQGITSAGVPDTIIVTGTSVHPYVTADLNGVLSA